MLTKLMPLLDVLKQSITCPCDWSPLNVLLPLLLLPLLLHPVPTEVMPKFKSELCLVVACGRLSWLPAVELAVMVRQTASTSESNRSQIQNPNPTEVDFSWLCHTPSKLLQTDNNCNTNFHRLHSVLDHAPQPAANATSSLVLPLVSAFCSTGLCFHGYVDEKRTSGYNSCWFFAGQMPPNQQHQNTAGNSDTDASQ